ncbi:MAG: alpha-2-macroglobulin family protein [Polyangiaceae bacterium]
MRELALAGEEAAPPAKIFASGVAFTKGSWRWIGTNALVFAAPEGGLPRATAYSVSIPAGTKALDGSVLPTEYKFSFSTPPPVLERVDPNEGEQHLISNAHFDLRFNQPVDPKEVERTTKILAGEAGKEKKISVSASWPKSDTKMLVAITPASPLPFDSRIVLEIDGSLHGTEGPLSIGEKRQIEMRTFGPLKALGVDCYRDTPHKKCAGRDSVWVKMSNRVSFAEWKSHTRIDGGVKIKWDAYGSEPTSMHEQMTLPAQFIASHKFNVTITAGMKDEYGQKLAHDVTLPFETDDEWPSVEVGLSGTVFESASAKAKARSIPIGSVNVDAYKMVTATPDEAELARFVARDQSDRKDDPIKIVSKLARGKTEIVKPTAEKNAQFVKNVDLDAELAFHQGHGAVVFAVQQFSRYGDSRPDVHVVGVTDLAISAKMSRFGGLVWVTRLSDGKPVANAHVGIRAKDGAEIFAASTNTQGIAIVPADKYSAVDEEGGADSGGLIIARVGDDWTFRRVSELVDSWRFGASIDMRADLAPFGMLITDRGVYRPGETVRVKGIFREPLARGTRTPAGAEVTFTAYDPGGGQILEKKMNLGPFGDFSIDVPIAAGIKLGSLGLHADVPAKDGSHGAASGSVELAEYRPAEFKVGVESSKPAFVRGDKASFTTRGDYLFGAPMSAGTVHYTITRSRSSFTPPGSEDLVFDDETFTRDLPDTNERGSEFQTGDGDLSAKGDYAASTTLAMPHQVGPETVTFEAEVQDISRQSISGRTTAVVHPGEFYVALKPPKDFFVTKGVPVSVQVAAIDPIGKRRVGTNVKVDLVHRSWQTVVESRGDAGGHYESKSVDTVVQSCNVTSTASLASCNLTPTDPGYYILHATGRDSRGNPLASSTSLYVVGDASNIGWAMEDSAKVELVTNKPSYEVGDIATVLVKNPFKEAEAIVTLERAGVYTQSRQTLVGAMPTLKFPITADLAPNAFVSVEIVRGRSKAAPEKGADVGAPTFRLGYAQLTVNPEARRLHVVVTPKNADLRPGGEVEADITVTDRAGKGVRSNVTFYAVDEGVLMLTDYHTPDPIPVFTAPRMLNVFAIETRDDLARVFLTSLGNTGADKGGEGGGGGMATRQDFRTTAYFEPNVITENGKAHVRFKLPDSLTTYRLMAVAAAEDDRFGFAESHVTTSRKLMARPEMPRFLRTGDSIDAGVIITSKGMGAQNVEVNVAATGIEVRGDTKKMIALPANGSVEVRFPFVAAKSGTASFTFTAKAGGEGDSVQITRNIETPLSLEAVALYGDTKSASGEKLGDLKSMRDDVGGLEIKVASSALVGLDDGVDQLLDYPYGCTEQLTSRLVPFVAAASLGADGAIQLPKNLPTIVNDAIAKIIKNQLEDGGFGFWVDSPRSIPWLTAYALWGLHAASVRGYSVPSDVLENARASLHRDMVQGNRNEPWELSEEAFELDVLADVGSPDAGEMNRLYDLRAKMPLFARALLTHAMAIVKMDVKERAELLRDVDNHLRVTGAGATVAENLGDEYAPLLDSSARTTAFVIRALLADDPKSELGARLARGLLAMRHGGTWRSTQETAWALVALDEYRKAQEVNVPNFDANVFLGDDKIFSAPFHQRTYGAKSTNIGAAKLFASGASGSTLAFQVDGTGTLFYEARLRYAKKEMPTAPLDRGFYVRKIVRALKPDALTEALKSVPATSSVRAAGGDLVLVDLFVVTPDPRENVVIDDPLPAGLEAVQSTFATSAKSQDVTEAGEEGDQDDEEASGDDERAAGRATEFGWYHREIRDDRVLTFVDHMPAGLFHYRYLARATTFGTYVVPPTRAECMYEPETFGRTAAATFEVK